MGLADLGQRPEPHEAQEPKHARRLSELAYVLCELAWLALLRSELSTATAYAREALTTAWEAPKHSGTSLRLQTSAAPLLRRTPVCNPQFA